MNSPSWLSEGHMKVWVQSGEKKVIFGTLCLWLGVYFISRFSLQQCASLETGQTCFQEFGRVKKTLPPARFKVSIIASDLSAGKILLTVSVCSVSICNTSLLPWCDVFKCAAPCECPGGGTRAAPRQFRASTWGFSFFLFFPLTNGKLSPAVRDKMPQTWSKFDRLPKNCAVCHPRL